MFFGAREHNMTFRNSAARVSNVEWDSAGLPVKSALNHVQYAILRVNRVGVLPIMWGLGLQKCAAQQLFGNRTTVFLTASLGRVLPGRAGADVVAGAGVDGRI